MKIGKHIFKVEFYDVYRIPSSTGYQIDEKLRVEVIWDDGYYLATCVDKTISCAYGMGATIKKAISDLLCTLIETYAENDKLACQNKLGKWLLAEHEKQSKIFSKRAGGRR